MLVCSFCELPQRKWPASQSAQAKLYASETASYVAQKAVQLHGGMGYTKSYPVERLMREAKLTEIFEGTSEIQRMVIAKHILA
ncbi:acyl-CoA dehydrogenase family protein [Escherichia albertii]|nr:acyl-CoA dehydrogenase family protein [Escherichia albertii]MCZ8905316.1 acyl-CoA dehydrogenase family protein [Escherichia albertii]